MSLKGRSFWVANGIAIAAAMAVLACRAAPARAEIMVGVDLDYVLPIDSSAKFGGGFAIRLGSQIHLPALALTPELSIGYAGFSESAGPNVYRGVVGLRLGIGELIRPGVFAHIGLGRFSLDAGGRDVSSTEVTYDAGLMLDFTLLPLLNLGVHMGYDRLDGSDKRKTFHWLTFGIHAEVVF